MGVNDKRFDISAAPRASRTASAGVGAKLRRAGSIAAHRIRAWEQRLQLARKRAVPRRSAWSLALMIAGLICIVAALVMLAGTFTAPQILLALGAALGLAAIYLALIAHPAPSIRAIGSASISAWNVCKTCSGS